MIVSSAADRPRWKEVDLIHNLAQNPSLENLKKRAETLKKACQAGDSAALERIRAVPLPTNIELPRLSDCQLVLDTKLDLKAGQN